MAVLFQDEKVVVHLDNNPVARRNGEVFLDLRVKDYRAQFEGTRWYSRLDHPVRPANWEEIRETRRARQLGIEATVPEPDWQGRGAVDPEDLEHTARRVWKARTFSEEKAGYVFPRLALTEGEEEAGITVRWEGDHKAVVLGIILAEKEEYGRAYREYSLHSSGAESEYPWPEAGTRRDNVREIVSPLIRDACDELVALARRYNERSFAERAAKRWEALAKKFGPSPGAKIKKED